MVTEATVEGENVQTRKRHEYAKQLVLLVLVGQHEDAASIYSTEENRQRKLVITRLACQN